MVKRLNRRDKMVVLVIENGEFDEFMHRQGRDMDLKDTKTSKFVDTIQLRSSFYDLLNQELSDFDLEEVSLTFGGGWTSARKIFRQNKKDNPDDSTLLLIDSDVPDNEKETERIKRKLEPKEDIFFMVQETEAWFLSQPKILEEQYGKKDNTIADLIVEKPQDYAKPSTILDNILKQHYPEKPTNKNGNLYQKAKDDAALIKRLNLSKLKEDFDGVHRLINTLQTKIATNA